MSSNQDPQNQLPKQGYSNTLEEVNAVDPYSGTEPDQRFKPRNIPTGATRGEQTVEGTFIIRNPDTDERILLGILGDEFGIFGGTIESNDENKITVDWKIIGATRYIYKETYNILQDGILPDGTGGFVIVKEGNNVTDVFD